MAVTAAQWERAVRPLLDDSDGWAFKGKLVYRTPVGWLLRGVHGGGSRLDRDHVYVQSIYMPLFVPSPHLVLSYGRRVPNGSSAFIVDELAGPAGEALSQIPEEHTGLARIAEAGPSEEACYALVLLGREQEARKALGRPYWPGDDRPFVNTQRERMKEIESLLQDGGVEAAVGRLDEWRSVTASALGVEWVPL